MDSLKATASMNAVARDRLIAAATIAISLVAIWIALGFRGDSYVFPLITATLLIATGIFKLAQTGKSGEEEEEAQEPIAWPRFLLWSFFTLAFYFLAEPVGVFIVIPAFMFAVLRFQAHLGLGHAALIAGLFTAAIFIVFELLLEVPTPVGILEGFIR